MVHLSFHRNKKQLILSNYTVCGISHCQQEVDNSIIRDSKGGQIPAIPPQKTIFAAFVDDVVNDLTAAMDIVYSETKSKYVIG